MRAYQRSNHSLEDLWPSQYGMVGVDLSGIRYNNKLSSNSGAVRCRFDNSGVILDVQVHLATMRLSPYVDRYSYSALCFGARSPL